MNLLPTALAAADVMLSAGFFLALVRLARGPTLPDRVVALDLAALLAAGHICVQAVRRDSALTLFAAVVLALLAFLSTVAFARHVERGALR